MDIEIERVMDLRFPDGDPVRAASAVVPFGDGWLVAQDDATHAGWLRDGRVTRVRLLPAVAGLDVFDEATGSKHLKPDLEAACEVSVRGARAALFLGSGSTPARMRAALLRPGRHASHARVTDLSPLYAVVATVLDVAPDQLNMEGACVIGDRLRWFQRGLPAAGLPTASADLELAALVAAVSEDADPACVGVTEPRRYELGDVDGVPLAVTDAVSLGGRRLLVSASAEDAPNLVDDGPVVGSALAVLEDDEVRDLVVFPEVNGGVCKVEGLAVMGQDGPTLRLLATVDADDPDAASLALCLRVRLR